MNAKMRTQQNFKFYVRHSERNADGEIVSGSITVGTVFAEDAARMIDSDGDEIVSYLGQVLWIEGVEEQPAAESYDYVAEICNARLNRCGRLRQ